MLVKKVENRFNIESGTCGDISSYPLHPDTSSAATKTNKEKSKEFGEVFTPLWLVDSMLGQVEITNKTTTLDLCAGYGQFSVRLMRRLFNENPKTFDIYNWVGSQHSFCEIQLSSCYKLIRTFGTGINLFIGDARELPKLPGIAYGVWVFIDAMGGWVPLTKTIKELFHQGQQITEEATFTTGLKKVITDIGEAYKTMETTVANSNVVKSGKFNVRYSDETRLRELKCLDDALNKIYPKDESVSTPAKIVNQLLACVNDLDKNKILVLFNAEIVEALIHAKKVDPKNIIFGVDDAHRARAEFVELMYNVDTCVFVNKDPKSILEALGTKRFDLVLSNPPYNDKLDLKIIRALVLAGIAKEYVVVHPSAWILDRKGKDSQFNSFKDALEGKIKSVKLFNGNSVFGIGLWYPCVITHIVEQHTGDINVNYFGDEYHTPSIYDEMRYGRNGKTIAAPFLAKMEEYVARNGSVWDKNRKAIDEGKYYAQFSVVRGHVIEDHTRCMYKDDFNTIVRQDADKAKAINKAMDNRPGPTFQFDSEVERNNFVDYLKTDFARFCLSLLKISQNIYYGEMAMIPWLDFTQAWNDEKLFAHFNIDQATQDYIRSFLPDYYGIRKNGANKAA